MVDTKAANMLVTVDSSLSLSSSWQKVCRRLAFLPTNLIDRVDTVDKGGGIGAAARDAWYAAALALDLIDL